jgi:CRP-like cAMP-binding protein
VTQTVAPRERTVDATVETRRTTMNRHGRIDEQVAAAELFQGLRTSELRTVTQLTTRIELPPGSMLTREGQIGAQFIVLLEGAVAVSACDRVIAMRGPGDFLGEISLLGGRRQTATALATTPVLVAVASKPEFWGIVAVAPSIADRLRATTAERLAEMEFSPPEPVRTVSAARPVV